MRRKLPVWALTLCHTAMGGLVGAMTYAGMAWSGVPGLRAGPDAAIVVPAALSALMAVGAGLTGFFLINIERSR